jgi:hypothetical protein
MSLTRRQIAVLRLIGKVWDALPKFEVPKKDRQRACMPDGHLMVAHSALMGELGTREVRRAWAVDLWHVSTFNEVLLKFGEAVFTGKTTLNWAPDGRFFEPLGAALPIGKSEKGPAAVAPKRQRSRRQNPAIPGFSGNLSPASYWILELVVNILPEEIRAANCGGQFWTDAPEELHGELSKNKGFNNFVMEMLAARSLVTIEGSGAFIAYRATDLGKLVVRSGLFGGGGISAAASASAITGDASATTTTAPAKTDVDDNSDVRDAHSMLRAAADESVRSRAENRLTNVTILDRDALKRLREVNSEAAEGAVELGYIHGAAGKSALSPLSEGQDSSDLEGTSLFLNPVQPFSMICVGIQGSGKSTSTNVTIEACMKQLKSRQQPTALAMHYDRADESSYSEMLSLTSNPQSAVRDMVVYTSVWNYQQRSRLLRDIPRCKILPLLFSFRALTAKHLMSIMCFAEGSGAPLYASIVLDTLRLFQRRGQRADFNEFMEALGALDLNPAQRVHLDQRLAILRSIVLESPENTDFRKDFDAEDEEKSDLSFRHALVPGRVVIVDLTNPLIMPEDANAIFSVVTDIFTSVSCDGGKLLVLDEAHKYVSKKLGNLGDNLLQVVRQMRHYDVRLVMSTQSPETVDPEFFELSSLTLMHHFFSPTWFDKLKKRIPIDPSVFADIRAFGDSPGRCVMYSSRANIGGASNDQTMDVQIVRPEGFVDLGMNRSHLT